MTTTSIAPPGLVQGAARTPLPFGLFSVVQFVDDGRWASGVEFEADPCEPVSGIGQFDCDPDVTVGLPKVLDSYGNPIGEASPFTIYGHWSCSPVGTTPSEAQVKANRHLELRGEHRVEQAFWTGDLDNTPSLESADTTVLNGGTATSATHGIGLLEGFIADTYGAVGVVHVPREGAIYLISEGMLKVDGAVLRTVLGTPAVAGAGYPGTGPTGQAVTEPQFWAYVTPAIFGRRGPVESSSARPGDLFDRGSNQLTAIAEQSYLLGFDPCGVAAVLIDPAS